MAEPGFQSDAELAEELASFGEVIQLPIKPNKRPILLKKLNHLRARSRAQEAPIPKPKGRGKARQSSQAQQVLPPPSVQTPGTSSDSRRRSTGAPVGKRNDFSPVKSGSKRISLGQPPQRNLDAFSSDDSDTEPISSFAHLHRSTTSFSGSAHDPANVPNTSSISKVNHNHKDRKRESVISANVLRTIRRRTGEAAITRRTRHNNDVDVSLDSDTDRFENVSNTFDGSEDEIAVPSPARSKLYPDLRKISSYLTRSKDAENTFESSDSDGDSRNISTYEVVNKSINTSFPIQSATASFNNRSNLSDSSFGSSASPVPVPSSQVHSRLRKRANGQQPRVQQFKSWYLESLPQLLVIVTALFFAGIAVFYITTHKDLVLSWFSTTSNVGVGDHILLCKDGIPKQGCYVKEEVEKAFVNVETLFQYLSDRKGKVLCDVAKPGDDIVNVSVLKAQINSQSVAKTNYERMFYCCVDHILANPHWDIRALRADVSVATAAAEVAQFESNVAHMSLTCRLRRSLTTVLYGIFFLCSVVGVVFLGSLYLKYKLQQRETEQREVFTMVEKIIDILQEHDEQNKHEESDEPAYMAVQHIRDQLLPPSKRRKLQPIWEKAVAFIASNESRIRSETRLIHGEEFEIWHWLQPSHHNGKIWQGQAFGENNGNNSNQVIYAPTPCLKIRNMFDSNVESEDDWEESVTDAILEKCRHIGNILHIYVDVNSREGCVYLKCSDCLTAGKVRLALHGWWFDGRLVTVKHLKTDHYHKRWPESRNVTVPCVPSSDQMRSLSQPFYKSSLEMT